VHLIACPRLLRGLELVAPEPTDVARVETLGGGTGPADEIFVLVSEGLRALVVAASCRIDENREDIFWSPFPWGASRER
jgi:hypothetical protein